MNQKQAIGLYSGIFLLLLLISCKEGTPANASNPDEILVQYEGRKLRFKEVAENIPEEIQGEDSLQFINNYIDRWLKDQILIKDASTELNELDEINQLAEKYKDELLLLKYEEKLIREKLDTAIGDAELLRYYNSNKSNYKLESTIFRFVMIKANKPVSDSRKLDQLWENLNQNSLQALNMYCQNNADICFLNPAKWYQWADIKSLIPAKFFQEKNINPGLRRDFADFSHSYKIHFYEVVRPHEDPPLSFVKDQAKKAILHQRKIKLLENHKIERYEKELKEKRIQILNK
ncbi:MAG: hypothetical protein IPM92_13085 [Saprospiraceae bacterium]|nr:hypothetical protein [Saprospiraceae bacterium]